MRGGSVEYVTRSVILVPAASPPDTSEPGAEPDIKLVCSGCPMTGMCSANLHCAGCQRSVEGDAYVTCDRCEKNYPLDCCT